MSDSRGSLPRSPIQSIPTTRTTSPHFQPTYFTAMALMRQHLSSVSGPSSVQSGFLEDKYTFLYQAAKAALTEGNDSGALKAFQAALQEARRVGNFERMAEMNHEIAKIHEETEVPIEAGNAYHAEAIAWYEAIKSMEEAKASQTIAEADELVVGEEKSDLSEKKKVFLKAAEAALKKAIQFYHSNQLVAENEASSNLLKTIQEAQEKLSLAEAKEAEYEDLIFGLDNDQSRRSSTDSLEDFANMLQTPPSPNNTLKFSETPRRKPSKPINIPSSSSGMQRSQSDFSRSSSLPIPIKRNNKRF